MLAINDVLDGGFLNILTGDSIAGHIFISAEGIGNRTGGAVIRGEDEDVAFVGSGSGGEIGFSEVLGSGEVPVSGDLTNDLGLFIAGESGFVLEATASLEFLMTKVPSAILGWRTFHAPSKKRKALLSEEAPA